MKKIRIRSKTNLKHILTYLCLALILIGFDQLTKYFSTRFLEVGNPIWVIKNFAGFYLTYNEGAAWSMASGQRILLSLISLAACVAIAVYFKLTKHTKGERIGLCILFAGAFGNLIDRAFFGKVCDMLYVNIFIMFGTEFPIFNVADLMVTAGAIILIFNWIFLEKTMKDEEEYKKN